MKHPSCNTKVLKSAAVQQSIKYFLDSLVVEIIQTSIFLKPLIVCLFLSATKCAVCVFPVQYSCSCQTADISMKFKFICCGFYFLFSIHILYSLIEYI